MNLKHQLTFTGGVCRCVSVYWPLQTIMCAKLVPVSQEQKYIVTGDGNIRQNIPSIPEAGRMQKSCLIRSEVLLTINLPTVEEFELFNSFTIAFYLQSKSNKSTHMGFVTRKQKYPLFNQLMKTFLHRYRWLTQCLCS